MCWYGYSSILCVSRQYWPFLDKNRARVVSGNYLPILISQLDNTSLLPFAIPVLYNICIDYGKSEIPQTVNILTSIEPAQLYASNSLLGIRLVTLLSSSGFGNSIALLEYSCKLLELLISQRKSTHSIDDIIITEIWSFWNRACARKRGSCPPSTSC